MVVKFVVATGFAIFGLSNAFARDVQCRLTVRDPQHDFPSEQAFLKSEMKDGLMLVSGGIKLRVKFIDHRFFSMGQRSDASERTPIEMQILSHDAHSGNAHPVGKLAETVGDVSLAPINLSLNLEGKIANAACELRGI